MKQEGPEASKGSQTLEKWSTTGSGRPATLRAGAMGKGREGDKSPSQGLGRKGFMNLSTGPLHALRLSASADLIASRIPPGRIDWVVGGRVVFFVFVVLSVFPVFVGLLAFLLCC